MNRNRILVVEDDEVLRRLYKFLLESEGYEVLVTESGMESVLGILDSDQGGFGLVLLDIHKPRGSWNDTLKDINLISSRVPVAATTGFLLSGETEIEAQVTAHGAACCLAKPMGISSLLKVVGQFCHS